MADVAFERDSAMLDVLWHGYCFEYFAHNASLEEWGLGPR
jgi:hypothetical protein